MILLLVSLVVILAGCASFRVPAAVATALPKTSMPIIAIFCCRVRGRGGQASSS